MTAPVRPGALATGMRVLALVALTALAGLSFGGVFAPAQLAVPVLLVSVAAVGVPFVVRSRTEGRPAFGLAARLLAALAGFVVSSFIALRGVGVVDVRDGIVDGWAHLLSAVPPVDFRGIVVVVPLLTMWVVGLVTVELEGRRRSPVLVAVPALLATVLGSAFGTGDPAVAFSRRGVALVPAVVLASLVVRRLTSGDGGPLTLPRTLRAAAPAAILVAVATVAGLVVGPHLPGAGARSPAMLRDHFEPPQVTRPVVNPMALLAKAERTRAQAGAEPPPTAFAVDASAPTDRYRLAVLDSYDGRQWVSTGAYSPTGHDLARFEQAGAPSATVTQDITVVGDIGGFWLPAAGQPVDVSVPVLVDPATGTIAVTASPEPMAGLHYVVTSNVPSYDAGQLQDARLAEGEPAVPFLEVPAGVPDSLRTLSRTAVSDSGSAVQQMFALQEYLKAHYKRRPPGQAVPGHSLPQLTAFLTNPALGQGSPEQFAASFALLARLAGAPSRLVVGYRGAPTAGRQDVTAADLTVWPEVQFADLGWVPFDPTPSEAATATDSTVAAAPAPGANAAIAEAAATPGTADVAAPESADEESTAPEPASDAGGWIIAAVVLVALVPLMLLAVRSVRRRARRRRRRRAPSPRQQVIGAWDEALDRLTESGVGRSRVDALTAPEVVHQGAAVAGEPAATELRELAVLANAASYSDREPSAVDATSAWAHERTFERHWAAARTRRERVRARLR